MELARAQFLLEQQGAEEEILPRANTQVPGWRPRGKKRLCHLQCLQKNSAILQNCATLHSRKWEVDQHLARCDPGPTSTSSPTSTRLDDNQQFDHDLGHC